MNDLVDSGELMLPARRAPALPRAVSLLLLAALSGGLALIGIAAVADRQSGIAYGIAMILLAGLVRQADGNAPPLREILARRRPARTAWGLAMTVPLLMLVSGLALPQLR